MAHSDTDATTDTLEESVPASTPSPAGTLEEPTDSGAATPKSKLERLFDPTKAKPDPKAQDTPEESPAPADPKQAQAKKDESPKDEPKNDEPQDGEPNEKDIDQAVAKKIRAKKDAEAKSLRARLREQEQETEKWKKTAQEHGARDPGEFESDEEKQKFAIRRELAAEHSMKKFVKEHGQERFDELFTAQESPYVELQSRLKNAKDHEAGILYDRAYISDDPVGELAIIFREQELFDEYGTRDPDELYRLRLEKERPQIVKEVTAELLKQAKERTGKAVTTLRSVTSSESGTATANQPYVRKPLASKVPNFSAHGG